MKAAMDTLIAGAIFVGLLYVAFVTGYARGLAAGTHNAITRDIGVHVGRLADVVESFKNRRLFGEGETVEYGHGGENGIVSGPPEITEE